MRRIYVGSDHDPVPFIQKNMNNRLELLDQIVGLSGAILHVRTRLDPIDLLQLVHQQNGMTNAIQRGRILDERADLFGKILRRDARKTDADRGRSHMIHDGVKQMRFAAPFLADEDGQLRSLGIAFGDTKACVIRLPIRVVNQKCAEGVPFHGNFQGPRCFQRIVALPQKGVNPPARP